MCDAIKTKRDEIINRYELPTSWKRYGEFYSGHLSNGISTRNMNIEEIEYKLECTSQTYPYKLDELFSYMNEDGEMLTENGILHYYTNKNGLVLRMSKENYTFEQHDEYSVYIDRYGGFYEYGVCLTQDCKYMCKSENRNFEDVYGLNCYKKTNKEECINDGLVIIDTLFSNYLNELDKYSKNFQTDSNRLLHDKTVNEEKEKGYYYEDIDESSYYKAYFITPTSFIQITQIISKSKYIQMKMVKTLANNEKSFEISTKSDYEQSTSGFEFESSINENCKHFITLEYILIINIMNRNIDELCPNEIYEDKIPLGSYSFTTSKLIINSNEYQLNEMGIIIFYKYIFIIN